MDIRLSKPLLPWLFAALAGTAAALVLYVVDQAEHLRYEQSVRTETLEELSQLRADIESRLNAELQLFAGMVAHITLHPSITVKEIQQLSDTLMENKTLVRSLGVSKQFTIFHVHPIEGNEAALGLNYLANDSQREPVLRAVGTRQAVLAGPIELVQGGQALIGRLPVFTKPKDDRSEGDFWGLVSIVIDLDKLYQEIGFDSNKLGIKVAIQGRDGLGQFGDIFYGDTTIFEDNADYLDLSLPGGRWRIAAQPTQQLLSSIPNSSQIVHSLGGIIVLLITAAAFFLTRQLQHQKAIIEVQKQHRAEIWHTATHDRLTGLPNRQLFNEELVHFIALAQRQENKLAVLFLDLDNFKEINDAFSHRVGDLYLQDFSSRLANITRETEIVARLGGDEFAIVAMDMVTIDEAIALAERITELALQEISIENNALNTGVSIGIAVYPEDGDTPETLVQHADLAMYGAKNSALG
ncbi:MAG: sensor domain-containing diguanylate cyclase, partial [Motiliproteus sp.]|nr:sensor domain-containing diguanylate cyclase [Motiliproteus sp.]